MKIQELKQAGLYKKTVAEILSMDRGTVAKYWDINDSERQKPVYHRGSILDPYQDYIRERLRKWPKLSAVFNGCIHRALDYIGGVPETKHNGS